MTYVYVPKALDSLEMDTAIAEIKSLIRQGFPEAAFSAGLGEDPVGMYSESISLRRSTWTIWER